MQFITGPHRGTNNRPHSHLLSIGSCLVSLLCVTKPTQTQGGTLLHCSTRCLTTQNSLSSFFSLCVYFTQNSAETSLIRSGDNLWDLVADACSRVLGKTCSVHCVVCSIAHFRGPRAILICAASIWTSSCCGYMNIVKAIVLLTSQ